MINNMPTTPLESPQSSFEQLVALGIGEGVTTALMRFFPVQNIPYGKSEKCPDPVKAFAVVITNELAVTGEPVPVIPYPFKESFKADLHSELTTIHPLFIVLWGSESKVEIQKMARTVAYAATLRFLERNREQVVEAMNQIRGV